MNESNLRQFCELVEIFNKLNENDFLPETKDQADLFLSKARDLFISNRTKVPKNQNIEEYLCINGSISSIELKL